LAYVDNLTVWNNFTFTTFGSSLGGWGSLRIRFLSGSSFRIDDVFLLCAVETLFSFSLSLVLDLLHFIRVVIVADCIVKIKESLVTNLEGSSDVFTILHGSKVEVLEGCKRVFAVDSVYIDQDGDLLMLLILVTFKDIQEDLSVGFIGLQLDFLHGQEFNSDVDFLILL
jgi:hypothetical protein